MKKILKKSINVKKWSKTYYHIVNINHLKTIKNFLKILKKDRTIETTKCSGKTLRQKFRGREHY